MKVIFLDTDGVLTHTDYLNWQTRHIDPEKVLEQIPSVISLDQLDIHCKHGTGRAAEVETDLPDGTYRNCVDGTEVQVKGGKLICQGEPMILEC